MLLFAPMRNRQPVSAEAPLGRSRSSRSERLPYVDKQTELQESRRDTREQILKAAEGLFAKHGYAGTSLRAVMAEAGVDNGAIHYHFKNKLGLLQALFETRVRPVNEKRELQLAELEQRQCAPPLTVYEVLYAFISPALTQAYSSEESAFNRVTALCSVDPQPEVRQVVFEAYNAIAQRFAALLRTTVPHLSDQQFQWKLECMYGAMMYIRSDNGRVSAMLSASHREQSVDEVTQNLVEFVTAGFLA